MADSGKPQPIPIPRELSDRFRVEEQIGQGGFGTVYRVFEPATGDVFALKLLNIEGGFGRARREIRAALSVQHPKVIRCYEADVLGEHAYFLFELAHGSLKELLRKRRRHPEAWEALCDACQGVAALHAEGLVHRDLKPSNILLTKDGAKIADLGLVTSDDGPLVYKERKVVGTPQYMSPEQAMGEEATAASDVYSLAVMAYVVLEGRLPYRGKDAQELLRQVARGGPFSFTNAKKWVRPELIELVHRATLRDPKARPSDVASWGRRLRRYTPKFSRRPKKLEEPGLTERAQELLALLGNKHVLLSLTTALALGVGFVIPWGALRPGSPAPAPSGTPPPAATPGVETPDVRSLRNLLQTLRADSAVRAALGLTGTLQDRDTVRRWELGRETYRKLAEKHALPALVGRLATGPLDRGAYSAATELGLIHDLLTTIDDPEYKPLFFAGEGPDFEPLLARARVVQPLVVPQAEDDESSAAMQRVLEDSGGRWETRWTPGSTGRWMLVQNYDWLAFQDPRVGLRPLLGGDAQDRHRRTSRTEITADLAPPGQRPKLELAALTLGWPPSRRMLLELVGRDETLRLLVRIPEAPNRARGERTRLGLLIQIDPGFLPPGLHTARFGARALQPMGPAGARVGLVRVLQRRGR